MIIKRLINSLIFIVFLFVISCQPASVDNPSNTNDEQDNGVIVEAKMVNNRDYYPTVYDLFENATKTIHIIMYDMKYYDYDPDTEESKLLTLLAQCALKGIEVKIVLEQSDWNDDVNTDNYASGDYLTEYGAKVRYDPKTVTTHCKTIIIDSSRVLVGSTNWSKSAINYNNETNVLLTGEDITKDFLDYFNTLWNSSYERSK